MRSGASPGMKTVARFGKSRIELAIRFTLEFNMRDSAPQKMKNGMQIFMMNADIILYPRSSAFFRVLFSGQGKVGHE